MQGNFVEKTKLSLLSRTLFKDEAERKSQNLPEIFNPPSQEKQQQLGVQAHQQQTEEASKRPLFNPKAPRPRLAGLPFGFKPAKPKVKEPRESFNISKFSRKGSTKFLPPRLKYFGAKQVEEKTTTPQAITTVEELNTMSTLEQESQETTFEMTPSKMTTAKMESTMVTKSTTTTSTTMSSTRDTTHRARTKGRGNGAVRRRKPVGQVTTVRTADTGMTEQIEPVTNTDNEDMNTKEWNNVDDLTTMIDDAVTISDAVILTTQEDTSTITSTTLTTPTSTTLSSSSTSKKTEVKKIQVPKKSRGRGRTRTRLGIGEKRKSSQNRTNSESTAKKSDIESSENGRTRGRVRGRGRPRKPQTSENKESKKDSVDSLQDKQINNKTSLKMKDKGSRNAQREKKVQTSPRLRGRSRGSHRFSARTNVKSKSEAVKEEDRAAAPDFRGSRRRLGDVPLENNKEIKNEQVMSQEEKISGSNSSKNEISSSTDNEMTSASPKSPSTDDIPKQVGPNGGFGRKFLMKKKAEEDKMIKASAETNKVSGRQRGRFTKQRPEESSKLDSAKRVSGRRAGMRANKIRPRHRGTKLEETNAVITQSEQGLLKTGKKENTRMSVRSRSSRRQFQNRLEKGSEKEEKETKMALTARGRGRARGRFVKNKSSAATTAATTTLSTTAKTNITASSTASTTTKVSTTVIPTTTNTNNGAADETTEETSTLTVESDTGFENYDATEYHFFPAESDRSKEKYKQQQETAAVTETQVESDHGDTFVTIEEDDDLSQHLNSALNLATVTWTQVTW